MNVKTILLFSLLTLSTIVICGHIFEKEYINENSVYFIGTGGELPLPVSLEMYELIEEFSSKYDIPKHIAYNVAFKETRYGGPFHWTYNPYRTSTSGAEGPMQIMPATAKGIHKKDIDRETLRTDLKLNVETSMKLLRRLYDKYGDWSLVCGYYNTGQPIVNSYALFCSNNINYVKNWSSPN
jgi:soluble lytic murein transglycosylase-like protein